MRPFFIEVSQMLQSGNSVTLRAKGNSMLPFIMEERDTVVLQKAEAFAVGSVVLACLPGNRYVLHRVYRMKGRTYHVDRGTETSMPRNAAAGKTWQG